MKQLPLTPRATSRPKYASVQPHSLLLRTTGHPIADTHASVKEHEQAQAAHRCLTPAKGSCPGTACLPQ